MSVKILASLSETRKFAFEFAQGLEARTIVLLEGEMGVGKTQFTSYLVEALGGADVASPSFAIQNSYSIAAGSLEHFDLFRITGVHDLESTGFWDVFETDAIVVIEWAERLREFEVVGQLPASWKKLTLAFALDASGKRTVTTS